MLSFPSLFSALLSVLAPRGDKREAERRREREGGRETDADGIARSRESNKEENAGIFFAKIDVDELADISKDLGIRAMPTFFVFKDGEKVDELVGANPAALTALITKATGAA